MICRIFLLLIIAILPTFVFAQFVDDDERLAAYTVNADSVSMESMMADTIYDNTKMEWPANVVARLDQLVMHPMFNISQLGLMVYDLTADSAIYCKNERQRMRPASILKNITAITAIDKLGGSYQFHTSLYYYGNINGNVLNGDLYCVGGMDPKFNNDDMMAFVESVMRMGIDTIRGMIVVDKSFKDNKEYGEGWCWDDDNPVLSPLLISGKDKFLEKFEEQLRNSGVVVEAVNALGRVPNGARILCTRFHSLDEILMTMMKYSNNLYAESMFYQLAAFGMNTPATANNAVSHINNLIRKLGLNPSSYKIADGSGLSLYNYVTPELEVRLLRYAYHTPTIYTHLYEALPIAAVDGTLKKRMMGTFAADNVHAKTGTVTGISSLAGYCTAANGHQLCFCIINQGVLNSQNGRNFQDRVCMALCRP